MRRLEIKGARVESGNDDVRRQENKMTKRDWQDSERNSTASGSKREEGRQILVPA